MKHYCLYFCLLAALRPVLAFAKGDWGSGGGDAMVCFATQAQKTRFTDLWKKHNTIDASLVKGVYSLDLFEAQGQLTYKAVDQINDVNTILDSVGEKISRYSPLFGIKIQQSRNLWPLNKWIPVTKNAFVEIPDEGKIDFSKIDSKLLKSCLKIQLVDRKWHSKRNLQNPEIWPHYQKDLFDLMDPTHAAALLLHEWLYILAVENHEHPLNSTTVRYMVASFFSDQLWAALTKSFSGDDIPTAKKFQIWLGQVFSDYIYLADAGPGPKDLKPYTFASRYRSYSSMTDKLKDLQKACLQKKRKANPKIDKWVARSECQDEIFQTKPERLATVFTDEESFLFVSRFILENHIDLVSEYQLVYAPELIAPALRPLIEESLTLACDFLSENEHLKAAPLWLEAERYCRALKK